MNSLTESRAKRIVLLAGKGISTNIVYNALHEELNIVCTIIEDPVSRMELIKKRIKRFGLFKVLGQLFFQVLIPRILNLTSKKRKQEIVMEYGLDPTPPERNVFFVKSINSSKTIEMLREMKPDIVIVNGTRIISKAVLSTTECLFINTHAGITPKYRNVHGAYWALVKNDPDRCGVTVHKVDTGIDTGNIIYQKVIRPGKRDNFVTYPLLQIAEGVNLLKKAIVDYSAGSLICRPASGESKLWYHPTLLQYLYYRLVKGIK